MSDQERGGGWPHQLDVQRLEMARFIDWCKENGHPVPEKVVSRFEFVRATQAYIEAAQHLGERFISNPHELLPDAEVAAQEATEIIFSSRGYLDRAS